MNPDEGKPSTGKKGKKSKSRQNSERKSECENVDTSSTAENVVAKFSAPSPSTSTSASTIDETQNQSVFSMPTPPMHEGSTEEYSSTPEAESQRLRTSRDNISLERGRRRTSTNSNDFDHSFESSTTDPELAGLITEANNEENNNSGPNSPATVSVMGFTKRQWTTLMIFSIADFLGGIVYSLQAPFYPQEAEKKGATATEYGLVFGVFELTMFIASPIYGKYMARLGARNVFNMGMFITGSCCIFFGFLDRINDPTTFIALSFLTRIVEAIGNAGFATATFTIIACEFPESVATTFASLETFFGLGLIVGPTLGGGLFQVGGYVLPFAVTGGLIFVTALIVACIMPPSSADDGKLSSGFGVFSILTIPGVAIAAFSIMIAASSIGFLSSTLEPHVRQFELTPVFTGLIFILNGGCYALTAPFFGWLCDKTTQPKYITLCGSTFIVISFVLIGPAPFIPSKTFLWLTAVGLVIQGLGVGATFVSGFTCALRISIANGFPDNVSTYSVVSGLWSSILALGLFVGPSIGGVLMDNFGFRWGSMFVLGGAVLLMLMVIVFIIYEKRKNGAVIAENERAPLIGSQTNISVDTPTNSAETSQSRQLYGSTTESNT